MTTSKKCALCGKPLPQRAKLYCSAECRSAAQRERAKEQYKPAGSPGLYREKVCPDCGITFVGHIKSYRCKACQKIADNKADVESKKRRTHGKARSIGSIDICNRCGGQYMVASGAQKYCRNCAKDADKDHHAKVMRDYYADDTHRAERAQRRKREPNSYVCAVCGSTFASARFALTCSAQCRKDHLAAYYAIYDALRKDIKSAYNKARWEALTDEEREEVNRKARENYHKRKGEKSE